MNPENLRTIWKAETEKPFSGWDFSYISDRMVTAPLDWSYTSIVLPQVRAARALLDMDTGGGEKLAGLAPLPLFTCATEGYPPNIPIARERLEPLGVQVYPLEEDDQLPFADEQFELALNRHGSYSVAEVWRVLQPGGLFITQQVGAENDLDINRLLNAPVEVDWENWNLSFAMSQLQSQGFNILRAQECFSETRIFDVGALVYFLTAIPWQVPEFSVDAYFDALLKLHVQIEQDGYISIRSHRFLIVVSRPPFHA